MSYKSKGRKQKEEQNREIDHASRRMNTTSYEMRFVCFFNSVQELNNNNNNCVNGIVTATFCDALNTFDLRKN